MKSELVEKAAEIYPDPQVLINMVSKRVQQLNSGRSPLIDTVPSMGAADIALTEIIEGKIRRVEPTS
ncbi:MAG: DNA-directed RNA polymerase subunit omega [Verrucomicrobia bacterium]|nr:DNA-directed RNA polymerase subunit omega [Verrucomicrobiota bacterium]